MRVQPRFVQKHGIGYGIEWMRHYIKEKDTSGYNVIIYEVGRVYVQVLRVLKGTMI